MLEIFRKDFIFNALLLIPYCALLRIKSLLYPEAISYQPEYGYFNKWWMDGLSESPLLSSILMILFISFLGYFINFISNNSLIYHRKSLFPAVIFIFLCSFLDPFLVLLPVHIGLVFLLIAFLNITSAYKKPTCAGLVFNSGFFLALASLFYYPFLVYFFFGFFSLMVMKSFRFKDRIQYIIGFIVPYGLSFATLYSMNSSFNLYYDYMVPNLSLFSFPSDITTSMYFAFGSFIFIIIYVIVSYSSFLSKKSMQTRKNIDILYWIMIFAIPGLFFWKNIGINHFLILAPPLSLLLAIVLLRAKQKAAVEVVHIAALIALYYNHFFLI